MKMLARKKRAFESFNKPPPSPASPPPFLASGWTPECLDAS